MHRFHAKRNHENPKYSIETIPSIYYTNQLVIKWKTMEIPPFTHSIDETVIDALPKHDGKVILDIDLDAFCCINNLGVTPHYDRFDNYTGWQGPLNRIFDYLKKREIPDIITIATSQGRNPSITGGTNYVPVQLVDEIKNADQSTQLGIEEQRSRVAVLKKKIGI